MRKYLLIVIAGLGFTAAQAQETSIGDAIRYAQNNFAGTARFQAMGGAFGALGGDLSSISINPAGSAVFVNNIFGATAGNFNTKTKSNYFGTSATDTNNSFDLSQAGAVFVFENDDETSNWKKAALSVTYENALLDNSVFSIGTNPTNSVANYFLNAANLGGGVDPSLVTTVPGESISDLYAYLGENFANGFQLQQAMLGYQGFIINQNSNQGGDAYISNVPAGGNYRQQYVMASLGYNGKIAFNAAAQYKDKFYFGLNLNSHFTDYRQVSQVTETNGNNPAGGVQRLHFINELYTYGTGFSFNLGALAKVTKEIRVGLAYESPTWLQLNDELSQETGSLHIEGTAENATIVNPGVVNVYEPYRLQTPGKWTGSFAYVFGKSGLLSVDYALKDYSNTSYSPGSQFRDLNSQMSNMLDVAGELRIGGEYRIKEFSLRGGFRNEQSPYKNKNLMGDRNVYSAGIGYNFGDTKVDLAYSYSQRDYQQSFLSSGLIDNANFNAVNNTVSVTVLFEL